MSLISEMNQGVIGREEFIKLDSDKLIKFFREMTEITLSAKVEKIIRDQEIDGSALIELTKADLEGYGVAGGPATNIFKFISHLN